MDPEERETLIEMQPPSGRGKAGRGGGGGGGAHPTLRQVLPRWWAIARLWLSSECIAAAGSDSSVRRTRDVRSSADGLLGCGGLLGASHSELLPLLLLLPLQARNGGGHGAWRPPA